MKQYSAYVICGTPRSGSTLLCEMLAATGVAGVPNSYFRQQSIGYWLEQWGMPVREDTETAEFDMTYLEAVLRAADGGTGRSGLRLMWGSVTDATRRLDRALGGRVDIAGRLEQIFGPTLFIHLSRDDKIRQAISLVRAEQSGLWHLNADGSVYEGAASAQPIRYDGERIAAVVDELHSDDAAWADFFAERKIAPLRFTYETMTRAPQAALAQVLSALGRDPAIAGTIAVPTSKMGDETSQAWAERFRIEHTPRPTLRPATPADAGAVRDLVRTAYARWVPVIGREPRPMVADYEAAIREHRIDLLMQDGQVVGLIETVMRDDHLWVENVAVHPDWQGHGRGRQLLAHAEQLAAEAGRLEIRLLTNAAFESNVALYRGLGFEVTRSEPFMGGTTLYFRKPVS